MKNRSYSSACAEQLIKFLRSNRADELIRILALGIDDDPGDDVLFDHLADGAERGAHARLVAVVKDIDVVGEPFQNVDLLFGQGGAQRGNGLRDPRLKQRNHVEIPFHQYGRFLLPHGFLGDVETVQVVPLLYTGVSGEFRYFAASSTMVRPPKARTVPDSEKMGKITLPRNRS